MGKYFLVFLASAAALFLLLLTLSLGQINLSIPPAKIISFPKFLPTPTPSPWLAYVNDHYGYSINYPRTWEKTEWEFHEATKLNTSRNQQEGMIWQQVKFEGKEKSFQVLLWVNRQKVAIPQWLRWYRHEDLDLEEIPPKSNYQILGKEAYLMFSEKTSWGYPAMRIFFLHEDHVFELIAQSPTENLDPIYQEMITGFRLEFLD